MAGKRKIPKTRDYFLLLIIKGATKAGIHKDLKKHTNKRKCRKPIKKDTDE